MFFFVSDFHPMFLILPLQSIYYGLEGLELFMKLDPVWGSQALIAFLLVYESGSAGGHLK
jgi:hypothetical protein